MTKPGPKLAISAVWSPERGDQEMAQPPEKFQALLHFPGVDYWTNGRL